MTDTLTELIGTIDRVVYKNAENGFSVIALKVNALESVMVRGCLPELHAGTNVVLKGSWQFHAKFGRQFDVRECDTTLPASSAGIEKYLSSGLIKGIGPKFAQKLVARFGEKTLEVIDKNPQILSEVGGVGPKRVQLIINAWQDQKEIARVMLFLKSKDVSTTFAVKIYKAYGNQSIEKMEENPYRLVDDIWGVGFKTADQIALKLGLAVDDVVRIKAAIQFVLTDVTTDGHLYLEVQAAKDRVIELLKLEHEKLKPLLKTALTDLHQQEKIKLLSINEKHYLSLPQFYFSEKGIANRILYLLERQSPPDRFDIDAVYKTISHPDARGVELNENQQRGILACLQRKVTVITGGPGTGKTTLIKRFIEVLENNRIRFRLAAPTGRAAKRMFESTGRSTETLHRLLEFTPSIMSFSRNEQNALDLDFLIIDEASMIDVFLMHAVLKSLKGDAHLVLIGDVDQLPSVGAGNVLNDIIASGRVEVIRLTQIFRQAQDSMIIVNAHRVNNGEFPTSCPTGSKKDFKLIKEDVPENTFALLRDIYMSRLPAAGISVDDSVVLVPMNRGIVGTMRLNQELQLILNPGSDESRQVMRFGQAYRIGDRVMQIRNNYDKFVFNGDMGKITGLTHVDQKMIVTFGDRELEYDFAELNELVLSYAVSIHKSQGSEFQAVIIPLFMQHFILLQRNLIYTAITRAKKLCILVGQTKAIAMAIKNNKGIDRTTFLKEFLTGDIKAR
jgi:exodeoxyribonuclease V alpha subunit